MTRLGLSRLHLRFALLLQPMLFQLLRVDGLLRGRKIRPLLLRAAIRTVAAIASAAASAASTAIAAASTLLIAFLRLTVGVLRSLILLRPWLLRTLWALLVAMLAVLLALALRQFTLRPLALR